VAAKERKTNNKQQNVASSLLTGVRDRRLSHLKITRTLAVVLFLSRDDASNNAKVVVVFYRAAKTMPRLHANAQLGKKSLEYSLHSIARYIRTHEERRRRRRQ
jgi:hypothetical protein